MPGTAGDVKADGAERVGTAGSPSSRAEHGRSDTLVCALLPTGVAAGQRLLRACACRTRPTQAGSQPVAEREDAQGSAGAAAAAAEPNLAGETAAPARLLDGAPGGTAKLGSCLA